MDSCTIQNLFLKADIKAKGAELCSLQTLSGLELLWSGDPGVWPRQAPHLFPVIGRLHGDILKHQGQEYRMPPHGFARGMDFKLIRLTREDCTLLLREDEMTRSMYPFVFELRINISLDGPTLRVFFEVINRGEEPLPADIGAMPTFNWPLLPGKRKEDHRIKFEVPETCAIRKLSEGFLDETPNPAVLEERVLRLNDALFNEDALIFEQLRSHKIRYDMPGSPVLEISWEGFQHLALWSKPGADFVCIQPWRGLPCRAGQDCEFTEKPGITMIPVGGRRAYRYNVTVITEN